MKSNSLAVRVMANICSSDVRSSTGSNLLNIEKEAKLDPLRDMLVKVRTALLSLMTPVPLEDCWRIGCLQKFLAERFVLDAIHQDTEDMDIILSEPDTPTILSIFILFC